MKRSILCFLFGVLTLAAHAQFSMALVGGPHGASVTPFYHLQTDSGRTLVTKRVGLHFGFTAEVPVYRSAFYFQSGVLYSAKGGRVQQNFDTATNRLYFSFTNQNVNYIDLPLNLVYKLNLKGKTRFLIGGGPQLSLFYNGSVLYGSLDTANKYEEVNDTDLPVGKVEGKYKTLHFAANAFAGFEFGRVFLTLNHSAGLNDFLTSGASAYKHQTTGGTLGIFLGQQAKPAAGVSDKDKDGLTDAEDGCPAVAGSRLTNGCPDGDADGIPDNEDHCPAISGTLAFKGCPVPDTDGDGINDLEDACVDIVGLAQYKGCPVPDTDLDGINDEEDRCPAVAGVLRYQGCPIPDRDGDGINDETDQCPDSVGVQSNNGCPAIVVHDSLVALVNTAAQQIQFKALSAELSPESIQILDSLALLLKAHHELKLTVEGHTSRDGYAAINMKLSQTRAETVKLYLMASGIGEERITAIGYGSTRLIYTGKDPVEAQKNRRVELRISY